VARSVDEALVTCIFWVATCCGISFDVSHDVDVHIPTHKHDVKDIVYFSFEGYTYHVTLS
jgi:hypothetical protein